MNNDQQSGMQVDGEVFSRAMTLEEPETDKTESINDSKNKASE